MNRVQETIEWLAAWGGKPRHGVLVMAIEGEEMGLAISRRRGQWADVAEHNAVLTILRTVHLEMCARNPETSFKREYLGKWPECSVCRSRHGREIVHASE